MGSINVDADAEEDLLIWARGDVHGTYSAGRDAAVVAHGTYDASLTADNDIVFAYSGTSLRGSLTAGRWIGDGSTSAPLDPTEIDDVFSHGDIMAQLLAGTSASSDSAKGRIGTIGSIGNAGGTYSALDIGRVRSGALVTANIHSGATAFTGDNGGNGTGTVIILQNQSTLITDVPKPLLDPSERDQILADAADAKADALADRAETAQAVSDEQEAIRDERQHAEEKKAEVRSEITQETDLIMLLADAAVAGATAVVNASLAKTRQASDQQMLATEDQYNKLRAEIVSLRNQMRFAALTSQTAAVGSLETAKFLLVTFGDPAVARKQTAIQANASKQIAEFKVMFDARAEAAAKAMFGEAWHDHVEHYEDISDAMWAGFFEGLGTGARATGNAAIDTAWGFVTLGYGEPWEAFDTSGEGYATSYAFARVGFELLAGAGLGAAAGAPGKLGKLAVAWDVAGNGTSVGRGIGGVVKDGELNFADGVQIVGGGFGLAGNFGGAFSRIFSATDELADGTKGLDDVAGAEFLDDAILFSAKQPVAAQIESILENAPNGSAGKELYAQVRDLLAGTDDLSAIQKAAIFEAATKRINAIDSSWSATRGNPKNAFAIFMGEARPFGFLVDHQGGIWTIKDFFNSGGFNIFTGIVDFSKWFRH